MLNYLIVGIIIILTGMPKNQEKLIEEASTQTRIIVPHYLGFTKHM